MQKNVSSLDLAPAKRENCLPTQAQDEEWLERTTTAGNRLQFAETSAD